MRGAFCCLEPNSDAGTARSGDCGSLSPHGYFGIEAETVAAIARWMAATGR